MLPIGELETAGELHDRLAVDGAGLMLDAIAKLERGQAIETPQDESRAGKAPKMSRESARIDWSGSASKIANQIRGMYPWPGCHVRLLDSSGGERARLTLVRSRPAPASSDALPGTILTNASIATGEGAVEIVELQPEGKRPMPLEAFRNGHPWLAGMRLEST
jgi:methionyl-tRNA formyltransferase